MTIDLNNYSKINPKNGRFLKGFTPHNKGKKWSEWMDGRKQKKVFKCLSRNGNPNLAGANAKTIVGVKNGKFCVFESSEDPGRKLGIFARNIRAVCHGKRKKAGGMMWFFEESTEWVKINLRYELL
jgi:hypothetical protein